MEELNDFKIQSKFKVRWGDHDAYNHVNNVVYLKWAETARIDFMEAIGFDFMKISKYEFYPILATQEIKYFSPVVYPDTIIIGCKIGEIAEDYFYNECHFFSEKQQRKVAISNHKIKLLDVKTHQKIELPEKFLEIIKNYII
ncbi:MAG: acyl-CoA thioesterase [Flavobacteriales bacterium]